jgi:hypothetical protein
MFDYAEPSGTVSGIGRFIRTGHYFVMDDFDELVVETRRDGDVLVDPRRIWDSQNVNWMEEVLLELSLFLFHPR